MEMPIHKIPKRNYKSKLVLQISLPIILFTLITLQLSKNISFKKSPTNHTSLESLHTSNVQLLQTLPQKESLPPTNDDDQVVIESKRYETSPKPSPVTKCDLFSGEWVPNMEAPYYTNYTCRVIQEHQNCMKYGRPDTEFMKWKWKPNGCELPVFNPNQFLDIVKGKSLAFVGDSVARNHMQSLICLLSQVEHPLDISPTKDDNFKRWYFQSSNFTLAIFWSPFLVKTQENDPNGKAGKTFTGLYLDEANDVWTTQIDEFDYVIISAGHWFFRPLIYYEKGNFMGCRYCEIDNLTEYSLSYGYRNAFQTSFRAILERENFKGKVFLRTFAPSHFEGADWDHGGDCKRTSPIKSYELPLDGQNMEVYTAQMEAFKEAQSVAQQRGLKFELIDMTRLMLVRPDGHPSVYGRPAKMNGIWPSDCVHWCLPGPIDSWNDFLLEMLKSEEKNLH
ncbi:protein trichome birefringence-like 19 [Chenopodium quinoa]|uniref:Trichome birefringence-like N-terminal domain-containing protein n=1 Tax=Chenopodium quinoa TaxID=63459 RepID=A0A803LAQ6_CHEQI|nr:protein trichome birefringence-like 19 [Chenopodium quinoa]